MFSSSYSFLNNSIQKPWMTEFEVSQSGVLESYQGKERIPMLGWIGMEVGTKGNSPRWLAGVQVQWARHSQEKEKGWWPAQYVILEPGVGQEGQQCRYQSQGRVRNVAIRGGLRGAAYTVSASARIRRPRCRNVAHWGFWAQQSEGHLSSQSSGRCQRRCQGSSRGKVSTQGVE